MPCECLNPLSKHSSEGQLEEKVKAVNCTSKKKTFILAIGMRGRNICRLVIQFPEFYPVNRLAPEFRQIDFLGFVNCGLDVRIFRGRIDQ